MGRERTKQVVIRTIVTLFVLLLVSCAINFAKRGAAHVDMHENYEGTNRVLNIKAK